MTERAAIGTAAGNARALEQERHVAACSAPFFLLLVFLVALYSNVAIQFPILEKFRPVQVIAAGALFLLFVEVTLSRRSFAFVWPESYLMAALLSAVALSSLTAIYFRLAVEALTEFAKVAAIYFLMTNTVINAARLRKVAWVLVLSGMFPAAGGLANYRDGQLIEGRTGWIGIFANPNDLAFALVMLIPLAIGLCAGAPLWQRIGLWCIIPVFVAATYVTFSRGGMLGLAVVLALTGLRSVKPWVRAMMPAAALLAALAVSTYWDRSESFDNLDEDVTVRQRMATVHAGLAMFIDRPAFGVGADCSVVAWPDYAPPEAALHAPLHIHNTLIQALSETGLVGASALVVLVVSTILGAHRVARRQSAKEQGVGQLTRACGTALIGFGACSLGGGYLFSWFPYLLVGMVACARRISRAG